MKAFKTIFSFAAGLLLASCTGQQTDPALEAAEGVISRAAGTTENIELALIAPHEGKDCYEIKAEDGRLSIKGSSATALCYAFNTYLHEACNAQLTWSGKHLDLPSEWPDYEASATSPYQFRYFLNVCTFGYTTPFWDWDRWSEELDWMALHGVNMPLASVASEAIARRVWTKLGLPEEEADAFFTGPAHLPWHRMGNLNAWDGPLNEEWHQGQIALQHKILDKMRSLGMEPVAPAFAGFVPPAFMKIHPEIEARQLVWGGFDVEDNACVLSPDSPWFEKIGKLFIEEWEAEFGKAKYFLSDSFNEMRLPVDKDDVAGKHALLAQYGEAIYRSIVAGNPDAVWVTQGWTFGYQHDFWDQESMQALLSKVPDDRLIIVDLGNDYPKWVWHTEQTWKTQQGFWGKQWIYSYVPNFGGKVLPTGDLAMYASGSVEALKSPYGRNLVGFGSAPEGLENNEIVYELLADMGWAHESIDLEKWTEHYCKARYGYCDAGMMDIYRHFRQTVWSNLYSYPRFTWQTVVPDQRRKSMHRINDEFGAAVEEFLGYAERCGNSPLYVNDAVEFSALWLGELADRHYERALAAGRTPEGMEELDRTVEILRQVDRLLASHPEYRLQEWVDYARKASVDPARKDAYEANAKRLITTWGGWQEDYAARFWSGLVGDYYIPRLQLHFSDDAEKLDAWEENWIRTPWHGTVSPFEAPVEEARRLIDLYR